MNQPIEFLVDSTEPLPSPSRDKILNNLSHSMVEVEFPWHWNDKRAFTNMLDMMAKFQGGAYYSDGMQFRTYCFPNQRVAAKFTSLVNRIDKKRIVAVVC